MLALVACLALAAPQLAAEPPASLRELVARSTCIAQVRVDEVRGIRVRESPELRALWPGDEPPFASLRIDALVVADEFGFPPVVFVGDAAGATRLATGERALLFLGPDRDFRHRLRDDERTRSREFLAGRAPCTILPGGLRRLSADGERVLRPPGAPPVGDPDADELPRRQLEAALELALELELPRFEVRRISNGVRPFAFRLAADGRLSGSAAGWVEASYLRALWAAVERERFLELPERVGRSDAPCASAMKLTVVTRRARRQVIIDLGAIAELPPGPLRDATERALRVWDALPIPERPVLR